MPGIHREEFTAAVHDGPWSAVRCIHPKLRPFEHTTHPNPVAEFIIDHHLIEMPNPFDGRK